MAATTTPKMSGHGFATGVSSIELENAGFDRTSWDFCKGSRSRFRRPPTLFSYYPLVLSLFVQFILL